MAKKSNTARIDRLEQVCMGAGFLLQTLQARYGANFGEGIAEQVRHCISDCKQIERARTQRQDQASASGNTAA